MKKKRFNEEQIIRILKEEEGSVSIRDLCRKYNVTEQTFYRWRNKYGGMEVSDVVHLKGLEDENRRLKKLVADLSLDNQMLKEITSKKW